MSLVGTTLDGRYEVVSIVGEGGMGLVYEGRHAALGRKVAIKVLHGEFAGEDHATQRFMQEAQVAGSLGHPNLCEVTDIGTTPEGLPYMVMPLLEGRTLADALLEAEEKGEGFPVARSVDIVSQILSALAPAHEAGIVHRDLKPENIFLMKAGEREDFVKILDFGISKIVGGDKPSLRRLTSTGMVVGTPYYMAPEQAAGDRNLDPRVDVYAVGALLYELLTGRTPFEGESYNEIIIKIVNETAPAPGSLNPAIPEALADVTMKAMAKDRGARFADVQAFRDALLAAGEGAGVAAPRTTGSRPRKVGSGNTLSSAAAEMRDTVPTVSMRATAEGHRAPRWAFAAGGVVALAAAVVVVIVLTGRGGAADRPSSPPGGAGAGGGSAHPAAMTRDASADAARKRPAAEVTVQFLGLPPGGRVTLGGRRLDSSRVQVPRSSWKLGFRAEAPGHQPQEGTVTPDQDRIVQLGLVALAKAPDAGAGAAMPPDGVAAGMTPPGTMDPSGPMAPGTPGDAMPPGTPTGPMPAAMGWGVIMGRGGTSVKTDYDAED